MENVNQKEDLRAIEANINRNLFIVCALVTLATMAVMTVDFFSRGNFVSPRMDLFYLAIVAIYSLHKEFLRWLGEKKDKHNGEYFVYAWVILTTVLYVVNFLSRDYFSFSREGYQVGTLRDIAYLTIEILAVFILTRFLKFLEIFFKEKKGL